MQRIFRGEQQNPTGTRYREPAQARRSRGDGDGLIEGEERLAALGFAADDADSLLGPQTCDQPSALLGAFGQTPRGLDAGRAIITLGKKQKNGIIRPVLHVLMPDGRVTEFKSRAIVIPEDGDGDDGIVAVLMNKKGELFHTPDGEPVVLAVPVIGLDVLPDPEQWLSWADVAKRLKVSSSSAKRLVGEGKLPKPAKLGKRKVGFRQGDVDAALAKLTGKK